MLDSIFDEFDTDKSGDLQRDQLHKLLEKVCGDVPITDSDIDYVLDRCDVRGKL